MIEKNTTVWFILYGEACKGTIMNHYEAHGIDSEYYEIKIDFGGRCGAVPADIFLTQKECLDEIKNRSDRDIAKYMDQINSVSDLVQFMYTHAVASCEEYTNMNAREAARRKAEAFGIHLSDN